MQYASGLLAAPRRWLRAHQSTADAALAAAAFALMLIGAVVGIDSYRPGVLDTALAALACGSLMLRRRLPWTVLGFTVLLAALFLTLRPVDGRIPLVVAVAVALCTVAARSDRPTTRTTGLAVCVGLTVLAMSFGPGPWYRQSNFAVFAWTGLAAAVGDAARSRRAYVAAIEERAVRAERSREEEARRRVAEERMRIARELHDVVAHHIALVNVQAGVAAHVMDSRPDQAKQALAHVREASRSALDELRATVGLLRQSGEPEAPMEPAPGLGVLDQLIDGFRRAGLHVAVECAGAATPKLPASIDLTAYRIIQESLTNVQKHAGPDAGAVVRISRESGVLDLVVDDDGAPGGPGAPDPNAAAALLPSARRGRPAAGPGPRSAASGTEQDAVFAGAGRDADSAPGGGHGLLGMHERASALGGVCRTGARPGGGFRVHVRLPLSAPPRTRHFPASGQEAAG
ncbi:histidine kinase [Actinacidiphila sp. DG2A-62]|uniref:sensor histidine kinase n=1 Tax=Actinacidiphila sp. DG2A-62 TaxID=3108821 RepID=UPI002DBF3DD5|nr:histidine kinase [Actinacidiphila sp. DG2A-62]MEC3993598.1 histidine kinase [Actinacidiphila sp. DG2A-62]